MSGSSSLTLDTIGIIGDRQFPVVNYNAVHRMVVNKLGSRPSYSEFAYSWNAVGHRFHGSIDLSKSLIKSLGPPPNRELIGGRHKEDQELFYFFSSVLSTIECLYYSAFAVGEMIAGGFNFEDRKIQRKVSPNFCASEFQRLLPSTAIATALTSTISAPDYAELLKIRNILSHQGQPGRALGWSSTGDPTALWHGISVKLDSTFIAKHRDFMVHATGKIVVEIENYLTSSV